MELEWKENKEMSFMRPSWDEYFMQLAFAAKNRAACVRRKVGAVIVQDKQVISTGYNGTPAGTKNCHEGGCDRCNASEEEHARGKDLDKCLCSHGEENAIVQAAKHGMRTVGSTLYTTNSPCTWCCKMIINAGVKRIVIGGDYPDESGVQLLNQAEVEIVRFKDM